MSEQTTPATPPATQVDPDNAGAIKSARSEAAKYRTERNTALRLAHAYRTMLDKHNINHKSVTPEAVEVLAIKDGAVVDEFNYDAPKPGVTGAVKGSSSAGKPPQTTDESAGLSIDKIKKMSTAEVNKNWKEISQFMENQPKTGA